MIRIMSTKNINKFRNILCSKTWDNLLNTNDTERAYTAFSDEINTAFIECFPLTRCSRRKCRHKPWFTAGLKRSSLKKNKLYKNG